MTIHLPIPTKILSTGTSIKDFVEYEPEEQKSFVNKKLRSFTRKNYAAIL